MHNVMNKDIIIMVLTGKVVESSARERGLVICRAG
jgi:hypothetical protein